MVLPSELRIMWTERKSKARRWLLDNGRGAWVSIIIRPIQHIPLAIEVVVLKNIELLRVEGLVEIMDGATFGRRVSLCVARKNVKHIVISG